MRYVCILVFLFCFPGHAGAQNGTADERASCNASFHQGCVSDQTSTTSSSGFAAPAGLLGSSWLEGALVLLLIAGGIARRPPVAVKRLFLDDQRLFRHPKRSGTVRVAGKVSLEIPAVLCSRGENEEGSGSPDPGSDRSALGPMKD